MKLTTRTVRHTKVASNSLRTINKDIVENYDSARVAASSDVAPSQWRHPNLPVFSAYARNVLANMPWPTAAIAVLNVCELKGSSRKLVCNRRRDSAGECLSDACGRKIACAGAWCTNANFNTSVDCFEARVPRCRLLALLRHADRR
jgi:hypothetical protein